MLSGALNFLFGTGHQEPIEWGKKFEADRQANEHFSRIKNDEQLRWLISQRKASGSSLRKQHLENLSCPLQPDTGVWLGLLHRKDK